MDNQIKISKYRDNILDIDGLRERFPKIVKSLMRNSFTRGDNFEPLHHDSLSIIRSLRTSICGRILVTNQIINGESYWVLLAHYDNHKKYLDSPLLKSGGLKKYYDRAYKRKTPDKQAQTNLDALNEQARILEEKEVQRKQAISEAIAAGTLTSKKMATNTAVKDDNTEEKKPAQTNEEHLEAEKQAIHEEWHHFNNQLIKLNEKEKHALNAAQPVIIIGMPGTGKTCVAMARLENALEDVATSESKEPERVIYVTSSEKLCNQMKMKREASDSYDKNDAHKIEFKTYLDILEELIPGIKKKKLADKNYFIFWIKKWLKQHPDIQKEITLYLPVGCTLEDSLYQECRTMTDFTREENQNIGDSETLLPFTGKIEQKTLFRNKIYNILKQYREHLISNGYIDPGLFDPQTMRADKKLPRLFHTLAIDEAQDLTPLQLKILDSLAISQTYYEHFPDNHNVKTRQTRKNISIYMDPFQNLNDGMSKQSSLKKIFKSEFSQIELTESLRCAKNIVAAANVILKMHRDLTGGVPDKNITGIMTSANDAIDGDTLWMDDPDTDDEEYVKSLSLSHKTVIITQPEFVADAEKKFPKAIVLTIAQAKGLEFDTVVLYRLFESENTIKLNKLLPDTPEYNASSTSRTKNMGVHNQYSPHLNEWFTAITRAKKQLIIYNNYGPLQKKLKTETRHIRERLQRVIPTNKAKKIVINGVADSEAKCNSLFLA